MRKYFILLLSTLCLFILSGCSSEEFAGTSIEFSDSSITVNGDAISKDSSSAIYKANDIVFYLENQGFKYGEGSEADEHSQADADAHTVVHITEPGDYKLSGNLSLGQIAIDLGEDAKDDPNAVVNLYLDDVDVTCEVAPAIIFYNVYECGSTEESDATYDVDTSKAGANVYIMDGTENNIKGSHVARIYESITLNDEGTEVVDSEKLHKYDSAFHSIQTMTVNGGKKGNGILNIDADNEGLDAELHLTINGGNINIESGNDGINTNEDGISVTTINGGNLTINVTGETGEGDGIDSNGWLVINGGTVTAAAYGKSGDAGIDSDMGIYINGGTVIASGNMFDKIAEANQNCAVFTFVSSQIGCSSYTIKNEDNKEILSATPANDFTYLIISHKDLVAGNYTLWNEDTQLGHSGSSMMGGFGGRFPGGFEGGQGSNRGDFNPEEFETKEGETFPEHGNMERPTWAEGEMPTWEEGEKPTWAEGEMPERPDGEQPEIPNMPEGETPAIPEEGFDPNNFEAGDMSQLNNVFEIINGTNTFSGISEYKANESNNI